MPVKPVIGRGTRVGAAAFVLAAALAGPQATGVASAEGRDPGGRDSAPASSGPTESASEQAENSVKPRGRDRGQAVRSSANPEQNRRPADRQRAAVVIPAPFASVTSSKPRLGPVQPPVSPALAAALAASSENPTPAAARQPRRQAPNARRPWAPNRPAASVPIDPVAAVTVAINTFFEQSGNWLAGLPANPISEFLQGALLLVRRSIFGFLPTGTGQTTGQPAAVEAPAYFTDSDLRDYLLALAQQRYSGLFGQTVPVYNYQYRWYDDAIYPVAMESGGRGGGTVSDTNTQVDGVDEADFVETDGQYLYVAHNGSLTIVDADSNLTSQTALSGYVVGEFLDGDRLTVITQSGGGWGGWYGPMVRMAGGPYWNWNPQTTLTVFDVSDPSAPAVASQTVLDGSYRDARAVDGTVYLVLDRTLNVPAPLYTEVPVTPAESKPVDAIALLAKPYYPDGPTVIAYRTYESWDDYVARVGGDIVNLSLPHAYSVDADGNLVDLGLIAGAKDIVRPGTDNQQSLLTVVSVDTGSAGSGLADSVGMVVENPGGGAVYMNQEALYLATTQYNYSDTDFSTGTRIDRFTIAGADLQWQAAGVVSGTLINQFAMDERGGYLHVATHTTATNRNDSGVYVLDTEGNRLDVVGSLTGLAPGEQLYAVRYVGDTAYLVTFLRTDPLFAIDLTDPTAPTLEGELIIPGFSNYLQSVGDGLLLGVGQEDSRLQVSLFDVRDPTNLTRIEREFLDSEGGWSWSNAQYDHHAMLYSPEDGLLVVPVSAGGYDPQTGQYRYGQTLQILRVDSSGIESVGEIATDGTVIRTVRIGDTLYAVSDDHVSAYSLTDLSLIGSSATRTGTVSAD